MTSMQLVNEMPTGMTNGYYIDPLQSGIKAIVPAIYGTHILDDEIETNISSTLYTGSPYWLSDVDSQMREFPLLESIGIHMVRSPSPKICTYWLYLC